MPRPRHFPRSSSVRRAAIEALESRTLLSVDLIKDINTVASSLSAPSSITDVNGIGFFSLAGLWKSDGTVAGTTEITAGITDASSLCNVNGALFFASGQQLWRSDGTAAGTIKIAPTLAMNPRNITSVGSRVYFIGSDGGGDELWTSDGTDVGTLRVKDVNPGSASSDIREMTSVNGHLFFRAHDAATGDELWISDGTNAGTHLVKDINPGASSSEPLSYTNVNGTLFFVAHNADDSGYELWKSDGTSAGTVQVKDIRAGKPGSSPTLLHNVNGTLMFVATDGITGYELWKSDGTDAGTVLVKDIVPGSASPSIDHLTALGSSVYFSADDQTGSGIELWKSDGTAAGTVRVIDLAGGAASSNPAFLTPIGSTLYFSAGPNSTFLYKTNGTSGGTTFLGGPARGYSTALQAVGSKLFFNADDGTGLTLWASDGSSAGTIKIPLTVSSLGSSSIGPIVKIGATLYFSANDSIHGQELWKSDGTTPGTVLLADLVPGSGSSAPSELTNFGGTLYFSALGKLWKSDGTTAGTVAVSSTAMSPSKLTVIGSVLYFDGFDSQGQELWKSDGTSSGTVRVSDIAPGGTSSSPDLLTNVNGVLYFVADDSVHGQELFKSDGTAAGTTLVKDIRPSVDSSGSLQLTNVNGVLFFRATDGINGWELWKSDGTAAGTQMVKDINPGAGDAVIHNITAVGNLAYFVADDGVHGQEIWKSDGTAAGTVLVRDIVAGSHGSSPTNLTELNGKLVFRADDEINGGELWISDGTNAGTVLLKDVLPGSASSSPLGFENVGGELVFIASNGNLVEPWVSDGTAVGTLATAYTSNFGWPPPGNMVSLGGYLYFPAWEGTAGEELRRVAIPTIASAPAVNQSASIHSSPSTSTAAAVTAASLQSPVSPDLFYDNLLEFGKPSAFATDGLSPMSIVGGGMYTDFTAAYADEAGVRALARQYFALGQPMVLDIEHWPIDNRTTSEAIVQFNLEKLKQIVDWAHDERPGLSVGYVSLVPIDIYPGPTPLVGAYHAADERIKSLIAKVDVLYPGTSNYTPDQTSLWRSSAENIITEAKSYGKPVRIFYWMRYAFNPDGGNRETPSDVWRMELDTAHDLADGAILWDDGGPWVDNLQWWTVTRDFMIDPTPLRPAAPTGLHVNATAATGAAIAWTDNAYNETGWRVERRTGSAGPFTAIASLPANAVTFTDTTASASSSYTYRVIPSNSSGDGFASNEIAATTPAGNIAPPTPLQPSASVESFSNVRVAWAPASQNETGFKVERAQSGGAYAEVASLPAGTTSYLDTTAASDTSYAYRILAYNSFGNAAYTAPVITSLLGSTKDPRGVWKLDNASGSIASDSSVAFHAGTLVKGPTWTTGTLGGALNFDGVDDHVVVTDSSDLHFTQSQDFTLSAWVNLTSLPGHRVSIVAKSRSAGAWYSIGIDATNHWIFSGPGGDIVGSLATTGWTNLAAVQNGSAGTRTLYVNGVAIASGVAQAADGSGDLWIGGAESVSEFFAGKIDDVRLYGSAWSASDLNVLAHPRVTITGNSTGNAFILRLDPNSNSYQVLDNNAAVFTAPRDAVASLNIAGQSADDQLTVDFTTGEVAPLLGLSFEAGAGGYATLAILDRPDFNLTADAAHIWRGSTTISYSNVQALSIDAATFTANANLNADVTIQNHTNAQFTSPQTLGSLTLNSSAHASITSGDNKTLSLNNLAIAAGASLDLSDNAMAIHYSTTSPIGGWSGSAYTGITAMIASGDNHGAWNGSGIVTSMPSALSPQPNKTLVAVEASQLLNLSGNQTAQWHNQTVDAKTVLVMNTAVGDADLNGSADGDDYFKIDAGFASHSHGYANGDFDYSGRIDADDYFLIDRNYSVSRQTTSAAPLATSAVASAAKASPPAYTPQNSPFADSSIESAYDKLHQDDADLDSTLL